MDLYQILLAILGGFALWCAIHRARQIGKPGFKTWPLIGGTVEVVGHYDHIYDWLLWNFRELGSMTFSASMPAQDYVFTVDPVNVEYILKVNFHNFPKGKTFHERFEPLLGNGIFNSDGEAWKVHRKTASFEFASRNLRVMSTQVFKDYAVKLAEIVHAAASAGKSLEMQDLFMRMTLDTICCLGFGVQIGVLSPELPENEFAKAFDICNSIISYRFADPFWKLKRLLRIGQEGTLNKYLETLENFTQKIIQQRRIQLQNLKDGKHMKQDILSRFMMLDQKFSDADLRDVILNFLIAGRDTTASTLSFFIYMIASHPESADKIHQELLEFEQAETQHDDHNAQNHDHQAQDLEVDLLHSIQRFTDLLTYENLSKLPYLHAALNEILRLYPAVPLNFKGVLQDDVLPDGTHVKKSNIVSYPPYCMGRMEQLWGSGASEFRPERWYKDGAWDFNVSAFKFTAFQAGPRICLGKDSAYLQMKIAAAVICRFFRFNLVPGQVLKYRVMATISLENGVRVVPEVLN